MAGRGTDIMLGGNAEFLTVDALAKKGLASEDSPEQYEAAWATEFEKIKQQVAVEAEKVLSVGGLYVLGTERHESRRIDNQLRGRSGRQGDVGESRFYLSLTDDLMRLFNSGAAASLMNRSGVPDDTAIESKVVSRAIASAQSQVEGRNAEIRKNVLKYDDVLNRQREAIYGDRRRILEGDEIASRVDQFLEETISYLVDSALATKEDVSESLKTLWTDLKSVYPISLEIDEVLAEAGSVSRLTSNFLAKEIISDAKIAYQRRSESIGEPGMRELERRVVLSVIDRKWRDHLYEMDYLKEGIGLRAMAQRDPLVEYQREGFVMFQQMMGSIREEVITYLFNVEVTVNQSPVDQIRPQANLSYSAPGAPKEDAEAVIERAPLNRAAARKLAQAKKSGKPEKGSSFFKG
jgi:preprotein translocase subunit SecA